MTQKKKTIVQAERDRDEQAILDAIRDLGGGVRFQTILDKLGWTYNADLRRLEGALQRLKKRGRLSLEHMRWSVVS